ncbi:MAG: ATP-binding protein, partial [Bdellovibrionota bacterium]
YRNDLNNELQKNLRDDVDVAEMSLERFLAEPGPKDFSRLDTSATAENWLTEIWDHQGRRVYTSGAKDVFPLPAVSGPCSDETMSSAGIVGDATVHVLCGPSEAFPDKFRIRVARLAAKTDAKLKRFLFLMCFGIPLVVVLSALAGYFLARRALSPIALIAEKAKRISADNLSERIQTNNPKDELGQLAEVFNQVFTRLEGSFRQIRRFTADAAHELRTPLSAIRTMGEVALRNEGDAGLYRDCIAKMLEESGRLQDLCENLLTLSKAEAGTLILTLKKVDLVSFVREVASLLEVLGEEKQLSLFLALPKRLEATIDPVWMRQAFVNLLDNAMKFSAPGGSVTVEAGENSEGQFLRVKDRGPGIPPEHLPRLFERFYRVDQGRARAAGGAGLGLSIAKGIVEAHGGTLSVESTLGAGTAVTIFIPNRKENS